MNFIEKIHPKEKLKHLNFFDLIIIAAIMFGYFAIISTRLFIEGLQTATAHTQSSASEGAAYSSNFIFQVIMLVIVLIYLLIRNFDFKSLKIRFLPSVIIWVPVLFSIVGLFGDLLTTVTGEYNYFNPELIQYINPLEIIRKFIALSPMTIAYGLLNGFYEEFFFLGLITSVKEEKKYYALIFSTFVRISFHTYQGITWALTIGVIFGLFYYFMYKKVVKNLLPFFLMHALTDMFGTGLIYLLISWNY
jgi:caax amino protease family